MTAIASTVWYVHYGDGSTTGYYAVSKWVTAHAYAVGNLVIPKTAPAALNERVYVCTIAGSSVTEPTWTFAKGDINAGSAESFQECSGQPGVNGDATNTPIWSNAKTVTKGQVITNAAGTGWFICKVSGTTAGSQPAGLTTPVSGANTTDNTATWTCIKTSAFTAWGAPHARLQNAIASTWGAAGDDFYASSASAEVRAAVATFTFPGTPDLPNRVFSVNAAGSMPPVAADLTAGARIATDAVGGTLNFSRTVYMYGFTIQAGVTSLTTNNGDIALGVNGLGEITLDTCSVVQASTSATSSRIVIGQQTAGSGANIIWKNTTVTLAGANQSISLSAARFRWENTASALVNKPGTSLFTTATNGLSGTAVIDGVDLSNTTNTNALFEGVGNSPSWVVQLLNCKLNASQAMTTLITSRAPILDIINCDSGATGYRQERHNYAGDLTTSTAIYNSATDGVTPISWHVVTTANAKRAVPFDCFEIVQWAAAGTYAASTIQITSATASLLNSDVWVDVSYLGSASTPMASSVTSGPAKQLTAGSPLGAGTWATGGLGNNYQLQVPSFTTALAGYVRFRVKVGRASLTLNIDPKVTIA